MKCPYCKNQMELIELIEYYDLVYYYKCVVCKKIFIKNDTNGHFRKLGREI